MVIGRFGWLQVVVTLALVLLLALVVAVVVISGAGDNHKEEQAFEEIPTVPAVRDSPSVEPTATLMKPTATFESPSSTPEPSTPTPQPTALPDRTSCDEIRGTDYRSEQERLFYLAYCVPSPTAAPPTTTVPTLEPTTPPVTPTPQPSASATSSSIEGIWFLLFGNGGGHGITFDAAGAVIAFEPPERAPELAGSGSIVGDTMRITASGFVTDEGTAFSFTFTGHRLSEAEVEKLNLPPAIHNMFSGLAFSGELRRSDTGPEGVTAVWVCKSCLVRFYFQ